MEMETQKVGSNRPAESHAEGPATTSEGQDTDAARRARHDDRVRGRLAEAETERDALRGRVDAMVTAEVDRLLSDRLTDPTMAMRALEKTASDFLNDAGLVDPKAVDTFVDEVVAKVPAFRRDRTPVADGTGMRNRSGGQRPTTRIGWADLLSGRVDTSD